MAITEAVENYLETILILSKKQPDVHAIDICSYLGYSRPTVSIILKKMKDEGLITVDNDNHIRLTDSGLEVAERIYDRHEILSAFFEYLGVDRDTAAEDAYADRYKKPGQGVYPAEAGSAGRLPFHPEGRGISVCPPGRLYSV